uniref:SAND domain-containing protein n=1 Tax=Strigamia maritima TaxID=126957 RepID=T1IP71_STRMM
MTGRGGKRAGSSSTTAGRRPTRVGDDNNNITTTTTSTTNACVFPAFPAATSLASQATADRSASAVHDASTAANVSAAAAATAAAAVSYQYVDMSMYEDYLRPIYKDGDVVLEVECGDNQGLLYLSRLCQGSKGPCILFNNMWLTPNEFQYISGRETAKDWKRSIRHHGKSMKLLLSKGILAVHPPICDCDGCRISSPVSASKVKCTGLGQAKLFSSVATTPSSLAIPSGPFATAPAVYPTSESRAGRLSESSKRSLIAQTPIDHCVANVANSRRGSNGRNKKTLLGLPASGYSDHVHELQVLIAQTQRQAERLQKDMDSVKKTEPLNKSPEPTEKKRESRLTSIIDQLLSNKAKGLKEEAAKSNSNSVAITNANSKASRTNATSGDSNDEQVNSDDNSSEDRREISSTSSATSSTSGDSVSSSVSLESGQSEISTGSSLDGNGTANFEDTHHCHQADNAIAVKTERDPMPELDGQSAKTEKKTPKKGPRTKDGLTGTQNGFDRTSSSVNSQGRRSDECAVAESLALTQLRAYAPTYAPTSDSKLVSNNKNNNNNNNNILSGGGLVLGAGIMPGDTLFVDPVKIKRERFTPDLLDSSKSPPLPSPISSPSSTSSRIHLHHHNLLAHTSPLGLEHLSPAALVAGGCATPPVLKQMEQMVSRNYSDIMRSLAAKYNNSNSGSNHDRYNGLDRKFDGRFPTPPLLGLSKLDVEGVRKNENHSAPPVLGEQRSPGAGTVFPCSLAPTMMDMSSTQALLSMVRSASANASQLETYLRGSVKRPLGEGEIPRTGPLDLTINSHKKPRIDGFPVTYDASAACMAAAAVLNLRLPGSEHAMATSMGAIKPLRDVRELLAKREEHNQADPAPGTPGASPKLGEARTPKDESPELKNKSINSLPCLSLCSDTSCSSASLADEVAKWTVDDVCKFVAAIDTCSEYVETFREQSIDGAALPMLTEEHLINNMNMKLGPALKITVDVGEKKLVIASCACIVFIVMKFRMKSERPDST